MASRYLGNKNTLEIHDLNKETANCQISEIKPEHKIWFNTLQEVKTAIRTQGYNGCYYCLRKLDTG